MDFWNCRELQAPPTYTYKASSKEVDVNYLKTILQDGIKFYKEQLLFDFETSLIARIIYRMKRKFHTSKDFKSLEKLRRHAVIYNKIDISRKLEHLLSLLPEKTYESEIFLPTKNMIDFILVSFQGVGKILCKILDICKRTVELYELRMTFGHFWRLALIAVSLSSRIYVISLNMIKYTCLFYLRLLPFSNHLRNPGITNWLPKNYVLPKDLKEWLNVNWVEKEIVVEIPELEEDNGVPFFNLVEDSDDDVEFFDEYIEIKDDEELEIFGDFKNIKQKKIESINCEESLTKLRGFVMKNIDVGEEIIEDDGKESEVEEIGQHEEVSEENVRKKQRPKKRKNRENFNVQKKKIKLGNTQENGVICIPDTPPTISLNKKILKNIRKKQRLFNSKSRDESVEKLKKKKKKVKNSRSNIN